MKHVLELPYGFKVNSGKSYYDRSKKVHIWEGTLLPAELRRFASADFSRQRWVDDELNLHVMPPQKPSVVFTPRDHQLEAGKEIAKSYGEGWRGFILADKTGVGKTLSGLHGICVIAKREGFTPKKKAKMLVVCPKGVIPQWRNTLRNYPISSALLRTMVINYEQLNKLIDAPAANKLGKKAKTRNRRIASHGKSSIAWDFIVFDEAHYLKNYPQSAASLAACTIASLNQPYARGRAPFVIFSTATPGATPLNFSLMAGILAPLISSKPEAKKTTPDVWGPFLLSEKFAVKEGKVNWTWAPVPWYGKNSDDVKERAKYKAAESQARRQQRLDAKRIGRALKKPQAPFLMRSPADLAGWPEQQFIPLPIEMTARQKPIYEEAWTRFRNWLRLTPAKSDPKGGLVEMLRYRQKTSLLKVEQVSENIVDWVQAGNQVYLNCQFLDTLDQYKKHLDKAGISHCEISGRNSADREEERIKFQKGQVQVCLCTVVAGISLHSNEDLPDGTKATSKPRITVIADLRLNNLDSAQALGRAHRDGENSISYIPYLEGTIDHKIVDNFTNKQANMGSMMGASQNDAEELERLFREAAARSKVNSQ
jgi:hypothetical protein